MTEEKKPIKIEFAPGCFDNFDGTQEELDQMIEEIKQMFEGKSGEEIKAMSRELSEDDLDDLPNEVIEQLISSFTDEEPKRNLQ